MIPTIAWAVTMPRALHATTARIPAIDARLYMAYPVFRSRREAVSYASGMILVGLSAKVVRVKILSAEQEADRG